MSSSVINRPHYLTDNKIAAVSSYVSVRSEMVADWWEAAEASEAATAIRQTGYNITSELLTEQGKNSVANILLTCFEKFDADGVTPKLDWEKPISDMNELRTMLLVETGSILWLFCESQGDRTFSTWRDAVLHCTLDYITSKLVKDAEEE